MASFWDARNKSVTQTKAELVFKCLYKPCTPKQTCSTSIICPLFPNTGFAIALWQIRLFSFLMLHFIRSHFLSPNNSSVRFCDAAIYGPCCNCSNEATLKRGRRGCRGNPCAARIGQCPSLRGWGQHPRAAGAELLRGSWDSAQARLCIQRSLLPPEGIFCSSHSLNSGLFFCSNKGPVSRASANGLIGE